MSRVSRVGPACEGRVPSRIVRGLLRGYQLVLSPWVTQQCRYYPSCSSYALEAVRVHGVVRGLGLAGWRLLRCNPFTPGGVDYVPGSPDAVSYALRASAEVPVASCDRDRSFDVRASAAGWPDDPAGSHQLPAALQVPSALRN